MRTNGLKILGLAMMVALGLMAFSAVGAQAALVLRHTAILLNATEKEAGKVLEAGKPKEATGEQEGTAILKIPAKNSEIRCEKGAVSEASVENETDTKKKSVGQRTA